MMKHLLQLHERNSSVNREDLETNFEAGVSTQPPQWAGPKPDDILFRTCVTQYFCGQGRSTSPFRKQLVMKFDLDIFCDVYYLIIKDPLPISISLFVFSMILAGIFALLLAGFFLGGGSGGKLPPLKLVLPIGIDITPPIGLMILIIPM